ncbi:MAG TPA: PQQ-dependent sugar dehydrogenase [Actinoplanes sp.]|jgi:glucose/arabinose dehydrogenase
MHLAAGTTAAPPRRIGRAARLLAVAAVTLGSLVAVMLPASAAAGTPVVNAESGLCLDVEGQSTTAGARVLTQQCTGAANQTWDLTASGELRVYDNPMCLDVFAQGTVPGALVNTWTCNGGSNQQWQFNSDGTLRGVQSGLCLAVPTGAQARLATCTSAAALRWTRQVTTADTQPPTAPGGAQTTGLTCESVTFSWTASTDDVGVAFYDIYHDGQLMTSVSGTTLSANLTVVPGAVWDLYVNARDAAGNVSQASASVTIRVPQCQVDPTAPSAPSGLAAAVSGTTVTLNWTAATDNIAVTAYDIQRNGTRIGSVPGTATTFIDSGLTANTLYRYSVLARDAAGNVSPPSNTVPVTTAGGCANPVCAVTQIGTDTDIPWGLVTLPDGTIVYARRDAHDIVRLDPATRAKSTVGTVPNVQSTDGEGGLMGLAIGPDFAAERWLYIMHTSPTDNRVVRMRLTAANTLDSASHQVLVSGILRNKFHNGGRLRIGPDGKLYIATGDGQNTNTPQDRNSLNGKILRINLDGSVPADNPFGNRVWSYGHRNPQGLAFDSQGRLWQQEFGNSVMDETNLVTKGGNYGWPACEGTSGSCNQAGFIAPKATYPTSAGSCSGIAVARDALYIACARGARMYRAPINGANLGTPQQYFVGTYGRLRTVEPAPDGGLWLTTTTTGDKDSTPNNSNERILHVQLGS